MSESNITYSGAEHWLYLSKENISQDLQSCGLVGALYFPLCITVSLVKFIEKIEQIFKNT